MALTTYQGSCHCGDVRFTANVDLSAQTGRCNCSWCSKIRSWGVILKPDAFTLLTSEDALSDYQFGTFTGHHYFCRRCGVNVFGRGELEQLGGAFVSIQVACLDDVPDEVLVAAPILYQDGRNDAWWQVPAVHKHL